MHGQYSHRYQLFIAFLLVASAGTGSSASASSLNTSEANLEQLVTSLNDWLAVGPFPIGKAEVDGDPLSASGWDFRRNASQMLEFFAKEGKPRLHSELVAGGVLRGGGVRRFQARGDGLVQLSYDAQVEWNGLIQAVGGMELLEWQAWLYSAFHLEEECANCLVRCEGVSAFFLDGEPDPIAAEQYFGTHLGASRTLAAGKHFVAVRMRAKHQGRLRCQVLAQPLRMTATLHLQPDWLLPPSGESHAGSGEAPPPSDPAGFLGGAAPLSIILTNRAADRWLVGVRAEVRSSGGVRLADPDSQPRWTDLAPGQVTSFPVVVEAGAGRKRKGKVGRSDDCPKPTKVVVRASVATAASGEPVAVEQQEQVEATVTVTWRCRRRGQSLLFTFLDADGSVQHAGVVHPPVGACQGPLPASQTAQQRVSCPVLLTLHGTGISASDSADAYKMKHRGHDEYTFGNAHGWTLAPSRHGAHNWEAGPGRLHALSALQALARASAESYPSEACDPLRVLVAGHSMGGHGALLFALSSPDRALALNTNAGWLRKDSYGDSNTLWKHDLGVARTDPMLRALLEAAEAETATDSLASNLIGVPTLLRVGARDTTVHPYYLRKFARLLSEEGQAVRLVEVPEKEHWWWDSQESNDGGVVNDAQLRDFFARHMQAPKPLTPPTAFSLTVFNPAASEGKGGLRIVQQVARMRRSTVRVRQLAEPPGRWEVFTSNVKRMQIGRRALVIVLTMIVDGHLVEWAEPPGDASELELCLQETQGAASGWSACPQLRPYERTPDTAGPMRQALEQPFRIVVGTKGGSEMTEALERSAVYVANLLHMTGHARAPVIRDDSEEKSAPFEGPGWKAYGRGDFGDDVYRSHNVGNPNEDGNKRHGKATLPTLKNPKNGLRKPRSQSCNDLSSLIEDTPKHVDRRPGHAVPVDEQLAQHVQRLKRHANKPAMDAPSTRVILPPMEEADEQPPPSYSMITFNFGGQQASPQKQVLSPIRRRRLNSDRNPPLRAEASDITSMRTHAKEDACRGGLKSSASEANLTHLTFDDALNDVTSQNPDPMKHSRHNSLPSMKKRIGFDSLSRAAKNGETHDLPNV
ncbi:hypothetical protein CYMTET_39286 [Cymbomonas tetramitiformis]|uniref:Peptidase S9 prolyl oligopeptidase catalytic domain-containing protein n=1 Tax=Cymbomonas tetramitiformis TaxID=36881 RepID=A0AAE0CAD2_9CHLO|nr:hypothetical protein CYMTET_39286 [Cymbomonas tetramitiformis]